jgi:hypothetical protein
MIEGGVAVGLSGDHNIGGRAGVIWAFGAPTPPPAPIYTK